MGDEKLGCRHPDTGKGDERNTGWPGCNPVRRGQPGENKERAKLVVDSG